MNWFLHGRDLRHERDKKESARNVPKSTQIVGIVAILTKCSEFMMLAVGKFLEILMMGDGAYSSFFVLNDIKIKENLQQSFLKAISKLHWKTWCHQITNTINTIKIKQLGSYSVTE